MKDTDFLFLTSMLRSRETKMLSDEKIDRMLDANAYDDAAKMLVDCGYDDMSGMDSGQIENVLQKRRSDIFYELGENKDAKSLADLFRLKYDYHNVKVLVKSMGANVDAAHMLSDSGRVGTSELNEAFVTGQRSDLPPKVAEAMNVASGVLSRTGNPQLSDIEVDKIYFSELLSLAEDAKDSFILGYVRLLIDAANLRIAVRSARTGRDSDFLLAALIPGGHAGSEEIAASFNENSLAPFTGETLEGAVRLGSEVMKDGSQTMFELACDNAALKYVTSTSYISFGPAPVVAYLAKIEWEITAVRMILTGILTGISPDVIRERLRDCHV